MKPDRNGHYALNILAAGIALIFFPGIAQADDEYTQCMAEARSQTIVFGQCGGAWVQREEGRLNVAWDHLMAKVTGRTKDMLIMEQGTWIQFKDRACAFYGNGDWGREGVVIHEVICKVRILSERTKYLEDADKSVRN